MSEGGGSSVRAIIFGFVLIVLAYLICVTDGVSQILLFMSAIMIFILWEIMGIGEVLDKSIIQVEDDVCIK